MNPRLELTRWVSGSVGSAEPVLWGRSESWAGYPCQGSLNRLGRIPTGSRSFPPGRNDADILQRSATIWTVGWRCAALAADFVRRTSARVYVLRQRSRGGDAERCAGGVESLSAAAIGKYAEVADSVEPGWQHMGHEPGNEHLGGEGFHAIAVLALSRDLWSAATEPHGLPVKGDDATVSDGDAMCIP